MFKRDTQRTPKQKAERSQLNIAARLAGCGFLIYYLVKLLQTPKDQTPGYATIITIALLVMAVVVIAITIVDFVNGYKTGRFKSSTYEDNDIAEYLAQKEAASNTISAQSQQQDDAAVNPRSTEKEDENL